MTEPRLVTLVTGASAGIGAEFARQCSARGEALAIVARRRDRLEAMAAELGGDVHVFTADLSLPDSASSLLDQVQAEGLAVDTLINNAGFGLVGAFAGLPLDRQLAMVDLNMRTLTALCRLALPAMLERGRGAILNVASTAAFQPLPGQAGYAAGKAFVLSYTQSLAGELRGTGVTATALCPGPVETGFGERAGFDDDEAKGALPPILWVDAAKVARSAVDGLARGRLVVIPGVANRAASVLAQMTPRSLLLPVLAKSHPGLKH
jgi:uncharacterized protein